MDELGKEPWDAEQQGALPAWRVGQGLRRLVLVDIENVLGGVPASEVEARWSQEALARTSAAPAGADHVVVSTCHRGVLAAGRAWPGARLVVGSGPDGADLALLEVLTENIPDRFDEVVLVSGDGIFTAAVARLGGAGVPVSVVAHHERLSRRLRLAAHRVVHLPSLPARPQGVPPRAAA